MQSEQPRVLIIESNDALRAMLFTILRHQPLAVDTARSADEALEKVLTCDYALILIDMDLPSAHGERFLREFGSQRPEATSFIIAVPTQAVFSFRKKWVSDIDVFRLLTWRAALSPCLMRTNRLF